MLKHDCVQDLTMCKNSPSFPGGCATLVCLYYISSHILKVPFENSGSGIVYIWIGGKTTQEEAIHAEQMGRTMFEVSTHTHTHTHHQLLFEVGTPNMD